MNIYMAGIGTFNNIIKMVDNGEVDLSDVNMLESFISVTKWQTSNIKNFRRFMLDSGAFTFLRQTKAKIFDWDDYVEKYAEYIKKNDVEQFFELDIDSIIGLKEVERLRRKLEKITNRQCIPVWHLPRGKENYLAMCEEYDYVAVGGIAIKEIKQRDYDTIFPWAIYNAHKKKTKVHGLGFTSCTLLPKYKFDSVDSTSFLSAKYGTIFRFDGKNLTRMQAQKIGCRLIGTTSNAKEHNFKEFVKFSKYAEKNL